MENGIKMRKVQKDNGLMTVNCGTYAGGEPEDNEGGFYGAPTAMEQDELFLPPNAEYERNLQANAEAEEEEDELFLAHRAEHPKKVNTNKVEPEPESEADEDLFLPYNAEK